MRSFYVRRLLVLTCALLLSVAPALPTAAQSRRQPPVAPQKKNQRPDEEKKADDQQPEPLPPDIINKPQEGEVVKVATELVTVETTGVNKKTKKLVPRLNK